MSKLLAQRAIAKSSPLYEYWQTDQNENDEMKRLLIANNQSEAVFLFNQEPYKWENLYQSIVRQIHRGDLDSIKGLRVLLSTIKKDEAVQVLDALRNSNIFTDNIIQLINNSDDQSYGKRNDLIRFLKILLIIFTNPYGINVKRKKIHIYEKIGWLINELKIFFYKKSL
tara:strand:- start:115 stop:621 length:507 start_codon:yes stop_codon:yes gene_type:complete